MSASLQELALFTLTLTKISETKQKLSSQNVTVDMDHLQRFSTIFGASFLATKIPLAELGCPYGVAKDSYPDGVLVVTVGGRHVVPSCIVEAKATELSPQEAAGQAGVEGTNSVIRQIDLGIASDEALALTMTTSGRLCQFGAVFALQPSFPVIAQLSGILDMQDQNGAKEAARCCLRMLQHHARLQMIIQARAVRAPKDIRMILSEAKYHFKDINDFFCACPTLNQSMLHLFRICRALMSVQAAVVPLAFRSAVESGKGWKHAPARLVFDKLDK